MKNIILNKAKELAYQSMNALPGTSKKAEFLEEAEHLLMDYLKSNMQDTEVWLMLIMIECNPPLDDYDRIVHYAEHILSYDPSNAYALLFLSYAEYYMRGSSDDSLYDKLNMAYSDNQEIMSMIELAKARYFEYRNPIKYEEALKKSIKYCSTHVRNFRMLGELYLQQGKKIEGNFLIEQGLKNVVEIAKDGSNAIYDPTSIQEFLAEFFAGTIMTN